MPGTTSTKLNKKFAAGVVGSLPRTAPVKDMLPRSPGPASAEAARTPRMDAAVGYAIALQESAGIDLVSDGEWRRHAYTHVIADVCEGFVIDERPGMRFGIYLAEPLNVVKPGLAAEEAKFLVNSTELATKVCIPSPYILGARLWDPELSVKAYPKREDFVDALVPILHDEIVALRDAGVSVIQIDEPDMASLLDPNKEPIYGDRQYDLDLGAAKINEMISGIDGVRLSMHMCRWNSLNRGWHWEGGYEPIIETLGKINVDQFVMEFSIPVTGSVSILKELPEDKLVGLGCLDPRSETIPTAEDIVGRVEEAMQYVDSDRLSLNPDCGFAPDIRHNIPLDECYLKLTREAEAAAILRERHG
jgi:5-methyltetrahydropteroyltriglutamate--homocysteine methyltransferase